MRSVNVKMNPAMLTVLLAAAESLYKEDKYAVLRIAALMERLSKEEAPNDALDKVEEMLYDEGADESDEIEEMKRSLGL